MHNMQAQKFHPYVFGKKHEENNIQIKKIIRIYIYMVRNHQDGYSYRLKHKIF